MTKERSGSSGKYIVMKFRANTVHIIEPKKYKTDDDTGKVEGVWAPLWSCLEENTEDSLEVKFKSCQTQSGTCEIQICHTESIAQHDQLMVKSAESSAKKRKGK